MGSQAENVHVRVAVPGDTDGMARLHHMSHVESFAPFVHANWLATRDVAAYRQRWTQRLVKLDSRNRAWVAEVDGTVVGMVQVYTIEDDCAELASMHVMPEMVGRGVGALLMETAIRFMRDAGFQKGRLGVAAGNERAWRFYERFGWKRCGYHDVGVEGVPVYHYCLDLGRADKMAQTVAHEEKPGE